MSLVNIAYKNVKKTPNRYIAYVASMAFTVMIYFLYISLVNHPEMSTNFTMAKSIKTAMNGAAVVIVIFTFVFLLFATSAFLRSRKKEFGLLSLLGMSKTQISLLIIWENIFVLGFALFLGISLGTLFQKLFLMGFSVMVLLPKQLEFYLSYDTIKKTVTVFGTLFSIVTLFSLKEVLRSSVVDLIKAGRKPKAAPRYSTFLAFVGVFLVLLGYGLALLSPAEMIPVLVIPVIIITCLGTYIAMKEASLFVLQRLRKSKRYFYKTNNFLTVSQLSYKMQDNYRTMSSVSVLLAVILTALGSIYAVYSMVERQVTADYPHHIEISGGKESFQRPLDLIRNTLKESGLEAVEDEVVGLKSEVNIYAVYQDATMPESKIDVIVLPYSYYTKYNGASKVTRTNLLANEALILNYFYFVYGFSAVNEPIKDTLNIGTKEYHIDKIFSEPGSTLINQSKNHFLQVFVDDQLYEEMRNEALETISYHYFTINEWKSKTAASTARKIHQEISLIKSNESSANLSNYIVTTAADRYEDGKQTLSMAIFIGFFVTLVFFAACCSLLYLRLFTDIDEDRKYFERLKELGVSQKQLWKTTLRQSSVVFMLPYLVGTSHAFFALSALATISQYTSLRTSARMIILSQGLTIALLYLLLYTLYFFGVFSVYWKSLNKAHK